jgi:hypothetical protein
VFLELKGAIPGFELSKKDMDRLASIKIVDQASKELTLGSVKSSLTGSTSDSDRQYLQDAMFSINDPKKFIKATLETAKAGVVLNREILKYVNKPENAYRKEQAYQEFLETGEARKILEREAPTAFADYKGKATATSVSAPRKTISFNDLQK